MDGEKVKALSLWQPWASLMADGRKKIETRHWPPPGWLLGQEFAIHATMRVERDACEDFGYDPLTIPRGCVVAIVRLVDYRKFSAETYDIMLQKQLDTGDREVDFGDYEMGRFGWECELVEKLNPPLAAKGLQGIWNWEKLGG
jgi:hypothetical protein